MKRKWLFFILILTLGCKEKEQVDLIIHHAKIYTVNEAFQTVNTMVIQAGKIIAVGGDSLLKKYESKDVIDGTGQYIYPGFIDAHCHFSGQALDSYKLNLFGTQSFQEVLEKVQEYAKTCDREWIEARGWDQNDWDLKAFPDNHVLNELFPDKPVFLLRVDGHAALCNNKALKQAGIHTDTKIEGGEIEQKEGQLTGMLIDNAVDVVKKMIPKLKEEEAIRYFQSTAKECFSYGLTSVVDCGIKNDVIHWLLKAEKQHKLPIRVAAMLSDDEENYQEFLDKEIYYQDHLHIIGYKLYVDGALGSRGARMHEPYTDRANHLGFFITDPEKLKQRVQQVYPTSYQLCAHAIGDEGNHTILNLFGSVLKKKNDRRWRIEHAQVIRPDDFHLFGKYSIIPSVQPTHATSDGPWAINRIGAERMPYAYAYKTLLNENGWLPLGTDFPVEAINPIHTFLAAWGRSVKGKAFSIGNGINSHNELSREECLRGMTIWAAQSVFEEKMKGSLEPGKYADFVIMDTDLMAGKSYENFEKIQNARVLKTYVNGTMVYESPH